MEYGSLWVAAQIPLLLLAFGLPYLAPAAWLPWPLSTHPWREGFGLLLEQAGLLLVLMGLIRLGRNLTPLPRPKASGVLVTTGIYGLVRHLIYGGIVLLAFAQPLRSASGITLPIEHWLAEQFPGYAAYREKTARLIPWVY